MAGEAVELTSAYKYWREAHDEIAMLEQAPRRWLRQHGQYHGLRTHMTPQDYVVGGVETLGSFARSPLSWPVYALAARAVYLAFLRRGGR